jgi:hypothetical protein
MSEKVPLFDRRGDAFAQNLQEGPCLETATEFLGQLADYYRSLHNRQPYYATYETASDYISPIFDVFAYLTMVKMADNIAEVKGGGVSLAESLLSDSSSTYNQHQGDTRFRTGKEGPIYNGACDTFMRIGETLVASAVDTLVAEVQGGDEAQYKDLWNHLSEACEATDLAEQEFRKNDARAATRLPEPFEERGSAEEYLRTTLIQNVGLELFRDTYHGVAEALANETLPSAEELYDSLHAAESHNVALASINTKTFRELTWGTALFEEISQARQEGRQLALPQSLQEALSDFIGNPEGNNPFADIAVDSAFFRLGEGCLHHSLAAGPWKRPARCAGRRWFKIRPQDRASMANFMRVTGAEDFSPETTSAAQLIVRGGAEISRETIFSDELSRRGLLAAAAHVRRNTRVTN